jgi:hypothetical protein
MISAKSPELRSHRPRPVAAVISPLGERMPLAGICGWFTEGFDMNELTDTKALLDELSVRTRVQSNH